MRASPHTRQTAGEEVNVETAEPGTVAENPPTIPSSWVTCPPRERTRSSAAVEAGLVSRRMTENMVEGAAWALAYSAGSALAGTAPACETGGCTKSAAMARHNA